MIQKREQSEIAMQSKAFTNIWNARPDLRKRIFAINNNSENAIKGAMNKAMGVVEGVSDMAFTVKGGKIVWIEWKTATGTQSNAQKEFEQVQVSLGAIYVIVRSEEEFLSVISQYE